MDLLDAYEDCDVVLNKLMRRPDSIADDWPEIVLRKYTIESLQYDDDWETRLANGIGDFPYCATNDMLFSQRARDHLEDILLQYGELLPAELDDGTPLWFFHCTNHLPEDAVNFEQSEFEQNDKGFRYIPPSRLIFK
ncbi:MAG: hypothetical protein AAGL98_14205, partial [Planctomycetota bacterium]